MRLEVIEPQQMTADQKPLYRFSVREAEGQVPNDM
jgi:hypothetical protein